VRINKLLRKAAFGALLGVCALATVAPLAVAQTQQQQQQQQQQFGPRANKSNMAAPAQGQGNPQGPKIEQIAEHGAWKVQCENPPPPQPGQQPLPRSCGMVQSSTNEKNPKITLSLILVKTKQGDKNVTMMRILVPIGVYLPTGVALEVDGNAVGRVPFTRCMPQVCMAFAEATAETLDKMRKGGAANFIIYEAPGIGMPMKMSLEGFSKALEALDSL
jgi:invasion protein IalB